VADSEWLETSDFGLQDQPEAWSPRPEAFDHRPLIRKGRPISACLKTSLTGSGSARWWSA
jgi:hypothetical protein